MLPGQRLSRCTCPGEDHPGPKHKDGTFVGRSAPEIDIFEAQVRSGCRCLVPLTDGLCSAAHGRAAERPGVAVRAVGGEFPPGVLYAHALGIDATQPFNRAWVWDNSTENMQIVDPTISFQNTFTGSATQQATSVVTDTNPRCYEGSGGCFSVYAFEVRPGARCMVVVQMLTFVVLWFIVQARYV